MSHMVALIHVDDREARLADQHGVTVHTGTMDVSFDDAIAIVKKLDAALKSGLPYKSQANRLKALRNSFLWAFGPEAEEFLTGNVPRLSVSIDMARPGPKPSRLMPGVS